GSGMVKKDVENTDKQDDGAAIRLFHAQALKACMSKDNKSVKPRFRLAFALHFVFGELFDAWFKRELSHVEWARSAFRAKFFLQLWHDHILKKKNSLFGFFFPLGRSFISSQNYKALHECYDSLIKLILCHMDYYPTLPFLPWQHGTECLEHLFGIARAFTPNFTYTEFIVMLQHIFL
ncbi:hypothetical protein M422DRAFT_107508, partial [Sphaerobolus stellatus SS14]